MCDDGHSSHRPRCANLPTTGDSQANYIVMRTNWVWAASDANVPYPGAAIYRLRGAQGQIAKPWAADCLLSVTGYFYLRGHSRYGRNANDYNLWEITGDGRETGTVGIYQSA